MADGVIFEAAFGGVPFRRPVAFGPYRDGRYYLAELDLCADFCSGESWSTTTQAAWSRWV